MPLILKENFMSDLEKVKDFLDKAKVYYFTTVDGDKPKCRPFGFSMIEDGKLYFGTGTFKECYKQILKNPNVEICAMGEGGFLRYYGKAKIVDDKTLSQKALDSMPPIKKTYQEHGWKMGMFYLENATAEFRNMFGIDEKLSFS